MSEFTSIENLTLAIPGAGRRTLLAALPDELCCPGDLRLCVLDATRMDAPAQIALLDELAAQSDLRVLFALNKLDRLSTPQNAVKATLALLRERGFASPRLWPVCASAARLFGLSSEDRDLPPKKITAQAEFYERFAPGGNSLSALSVTGGEITLLDGRKLSPEQLHLARINTGVPALEAALRETGEDASEFSVQSSEPTGAHAVRPQDAEASPACHSEQSEESAAPVPSAFLEGKAEAP
ncbi:MAG: hypothetical protein J5878_00565, partial [Oscillospiraceae bacterium]|nr:hypothetical protein [Oscillospiraceae bacterium]